MQAAVGRGLPGIVRAAGYAGLSFSLLLFAVFAINLVSPAPSVKPADAEMDKWVVPAFLAVSVVGVAISAGLLLGRRSAYRAYLIALGLVAVTAGITAQVASVMNTVVAVAAAISCAAALGLSYGLTRNRVRESFHIAPRQPGGFIRGFAWSNLALGLGTILLALLSSPSPLPQFGYWLTGLPNVLINATLAAASAAVGYGILKARHWVRRAAVVVGALNVLWAAGIVWDPNPQNKLSAAEAMTMWSAIGLMAFTIFWEALSCWLVYARWEQIQAAAARPAP